MSKRIHFIGICGVAMSALALAFKESSAASGGVNWQVTGSDVGFFPPISDYLKNNNIQFYPGWHPEKMMADGAPDIIVVGNVAGSTNPELLYARKNNLNCKSYPEVVAEYVVQKNSVVCAGTYGKTSSAALLALILKNAGLNPTYMFGGLCANLPVSAKIRSDENDATKNWSVLEGDEYKTARWDSRPKFKLYSPTHLLLTSVSWDHADIYPTEETYFNAFKDLVSMIPTDGLIVVCADAKNMDKILTANISGAKVVTYGKIPTTDYYYFNVKQTKDGVNFKIQNKRRVSTDVTRHDSAESNKTYELSSPVLGEHMAENICGAFALAKEIGLEDTGILSAIAEFKGIKRRLEKRSGSGLTVYDDLGHSPAKAAAALKTLRAIYPANKIVAIFEPNTGNRKSLAAPGYYGAFVDADEVLIPALTKIKTNLKDPDPPFDGAKLKEIISKTHPRAIFIDNDDKLIDHIKNNTKKEDVVVFLGSHGFRGMIEKVTSLHPSLRM